MPRAKTGTHKLAPSTRKICTRCPVGHQDRDINDFHRNKSDPSGRQRYCKACELDYQRQRTGFVDVPYQDKNTARQRAVRRLRDAHPAEYAKLYDEELRKVLAEAIGAPE